MGNEQFIQTKKVNGGVVCVGNFQIFEYDRLPIGTSDSSWKTTSFVIESHRYVKVYTISAKISFLPAPTKVSQKKGRNKYIRVSILCCKCDSFD